MELKYKLEELLQDMTIEELLEEQGIEPVDAVLALYEIGVIDLERYLEYKGSPIDDV